MKRSVAELIDERGGDEPVAEAFGLDRTTVNKWRRGGIPERHWAYFMAGASAASEAEIYRANRLARGEDVDGPGVSPKGGDRHAA